MFTDLFIHIFLFHFSLNHLLYRLFFWVARKISQENKISLFILVMCTCIVNFKFDLLLLYCDLFKYKRFIYFIVFLIHHFFQMFLKREKYLVFCLWNLQLSSKTYSFVLLHYFIFYYDMFRYHSLLSCIQIFPSTHHYLCILFWVFYRFYGWLYFLMMVFIYICCYRRVF